LKVIHQTLFGLSILPQINPKSSKTMEEKEKPTTLQNAHFKQNINRPLKVPLFLMYIVTIIRLVKYLYLLANERKFLHIKGMQHLDTICISYGEFKVFW